MAKFEERMHVSATSIAHVDNETDLTDLTDQTDRANLAKEPTEPAKPSKPSQQSAQSFRERVYAFVRQVPSGRVVTYGQIAEAIGMPRAARAVGNALHANPDGDATPCFRVVNAQGMLAPHFAFGGSDEQHRRLEADHIEVHNHRVDLARYQWHED